MFFTICREHVGLTPEERQHNATLDVVCGATGLIASGISLLLLSPILTTTVHVGIALLLVLTIAVALVSLIGFTTGMVSLAP